MKNASGFQDVKANYGESSSPTLESGLRSHQVLAQDASTRGRVPGVGDDFEVDSLAGAAPKRQRETRLSDSARAAAPPAKANGSSANSDYA